MSGVHREQVELCVDILERILMALSPLSLAQNYRVELQAGLTHPNETVKILALTQVGCSHTVHSHTYSIFAFKPLTSLYVFLYQIGRMVDNPDAATEILNNHDILGGVIRCIAEEKLAVAKQVMTQVLTYSPAGDFNEINSGCSNLFFVFCFLGHQVPDQTESLQARVRQTVPERPAESYEGCDGHK